MADDVPPPVISYHSAELRQEAIGIHRDGDDLIIVLAPVHSARLLLSQLLPIGALASVVLFLSVVWFMVGASISEEGFLLLLPLALCGTLLVWMLIRFIPIARFGRIPTVFRASRQRLQLIAPMLGRRGQKTWLASEIVDLSVRLAGAVPVLMEFIRLQVCSIDDRLDVVLIPSPKGQSLKVLEDALRQATGLPTLDPAM